MNLIKTRIVFFTIMAFGLSCAAAAGQNSEPVVPQQIEVNINTAQTSQPTSKYVFGQFIEHIGSLVYRSLWSEMLDDRKFYYPIVPQEPQAPGRRRGGFPGMGLRKWRPVGPGSVVTMDKDHPFVGEQSPRIELESSTPHGIEQAGLSLVKGKKYVGHIWLRGTPGAKVKVALIWGEGAGDRQTASFAPLTSAYKKFPFSFTSQADTSKATFEVTGTGSGDFHVGTVSMMPADNIDGFRPDTIALLKQLHSGIWRLPGGNFLSDWSWYDGVGPRDKRPPTFDHAWNAMQPNDVGMDEFMTLCKLIGVEPYITVNAGFGDAHSAAEEVEYINGSVHTRLGAERARNGHPAPYNVKFWNIGNEPWGTFQLGYTPWKYFVIKQNRFAKAMRKVDPSITLIASAKMLDDMFLTGETRVEYTGNLRPLFGSEYDWTGGILAHSWGYFDGIAQHWYGRGGRHYDLALAKTLPPSAPTDDAYVPIKQTPLEWCRYAANGIHRNAEEWEGYQQRFPQMISKKIFLSLDEYAFFGGGFGRGTNLQLALAYGMMFNEMLRHTDFLRFTAHTMGVSNMDYSPTAAILNTTGLAFKLYGDHFVPGSIPVAISGNSPQPKPKYPIGGDQPRTNSGSPTYPLDMFAALTPDRRSLNLAVVNATDSDRKFDLNVSGVRVEGGPTVWQLTGADLNASNRLGHDPQVGIKEIPASAGSEHALSVAPYSIEIYRFPVAQEGQ